MQYFSTRVSVIAYFYKRAHVTNISSFSWRSKKMPDQACFMAAYGPLSSVDVMMAPAFMSSSEKWVILIENTLPYYTINKWANSSGFDSKFELCLWWYQPNSWNILHYFENTSLTSDYKYLILINTREKGKYIHT